MDERKSQIDERARRAAGRKELGEQRMQLFERLRETLDGEPSRDELAEMAAELHAAHADHEERSGHPDRADAARQRERRARKRTDP